MFFETNQAPKIRGCSWGNGGGMGDWGRLKSLNKLKVENGITFTF